APGPPFLAAGVCQTDQKGAAGHPGRRRISGLSRGAAARPVFHKTGYFVSAKNAAAEVFNHFVEKLRGFFIFRVENICRNMVVFSLSAGFLFHRAVENPAKLLKTAPPAPFSFDHKALAAGF